MKTQTEFIDKVDNAVVEISNQYGGANGLVPKEGHINDVLFYICSLQTTPHTDLCVNSCLLVGQKGAMVERIATEMTKDRDMADVIMAASKLYVDYLKSINKN